MMIAVAWTGVACAAGLKLGGGAFWPGALLMAAVPSIVVTLVFGPVRGMAFGMIALLGISAVHAVAQ